MSLILCCSTESLNKWPVKEANGCKMAPPINVKYKRIMYKSGLLSRRVFLKFIYKIKKSNEIIVTIAKNILKRIIFSVDFVLIDEKKAM